MRLWAVSHVCLLVAIDATLPNLQVLLDGLQPGHILLLIQPQHDPLQQILLGLASPAAAPVQFSGLAIVAHAGSDGMRKRGKKSEKKRIFF